MATPGNKTNLAAGHAGTRVGGAAVEVDGAGTRRRVGVRAVCVADVCDHGGHFVGERGRRRFGSSSPVVDSPCLRVFTVTLSAEKEE